MAGQLMLSLSILIVLHEMGHFLPARWFKTRVEKFYLFFDPWFSLLRFKKGDTEYGLGWLPLGGYVKIAGMIDESFDTEQMKQPPQPWEFRSKPAWQRLIMMLGGVTVNFILGFLILGMVLFTWGEMFIPNAKITNGIAVDSLGKDLGLRNGDHLLKVGDAPFTEFNDRLVVRGIVIDKARTLTVRRDGNEVVIPVSAEWVDILSRYENKSNWLFTARIPFIVFKTDPKGPAAKAGIKAGDTILSVNGMEISFYDQYQQEFQPKPNQVLQLRVARGRDTLEKQVTTNAEGKILLLTPSLLNMYTPEKKSFSLGEALPAGFSNGFGFLGDQFKAFGMMFSGQIKASESLGGFGSIASMYGDVWNWERFWRMTAILSLILAFMNLLPIPALDGGHVLFLLYEMVSGRKPSDKFMEIATMTGFILILALVLFANGLDILRLFK